MKLKIQECPQNKYIATIKVVRQATGLCLVDAKSLVDKRPLCEFSVRHEQWEAVQAELTSLGVTWSLVEGERMQIRSGWKDAGQSGSRIANDVYVGGQWWTPVLWDGDEDPDWHKASGLEAVT